MTLRTLTLAKRSLNSPGEIRKFGNGILEVVTVGDQTVARLMLKPGWRWSKDIQKIARTESCMVGHLQYVISGRLLIAMDDGTEMELSPGDVAMIPPGHDAWVLGEEPFVAIDFSGMKEYARPDEGEVGEPDPSVEF